MLADAGVVRSRWDFLLARLAGRGRKLQAGEYRFNRAATPVEVFDRMARGDVFFYELVVPEGRNIFDIAASAEKLGFSQPTNSWPRRATRVSFAISIRARRRSRVICFPIPITSAAIPRPSSSAA